MQCSANDTKYQDDFRYLEREALVSSFLLFLALGALGLGAV